MAEDVRMGVQWTYLEKILDLYGTMVNAYSRYLLYLDGVAHPREKKFFKCALSTFYCSVKASFDSWLDNQEDCKMTPEMYESISNDSDLKEMFFKINQWAQTVGPFATLVKQNDPYNAWKNG